MLRERDVKFEIDPLADGDVNMATDLALLSLAANGMASCRIYGWSKTWVTLGRSQNPEEVLIQDCRVPWIVRPTGGGAVLHGHDVTIGFAFPANRSVKSAYRMATRPIISALELSGISACLAEDLGMESGSPRRVDCFSGSSSNDILDAVTGRKVCGCALRRTATAVLLQASIPVRPPMTDPRDVIQGAVEPHWISLNQEKFVTALKDELAQFGSHKL